MHHQSQPYEHVTAGDRVYYCAEDQVELGLN